MAAIAAARLRLTAPPLGDARPPGPAVASWRPRRRRPHRAGRRAARAEVGPARTRRRPTSWPHGRGGRRALRSGQLDDRRPAGPEVSPLTAVLDHPAASGAPGGGPARTGCARAGRSSPRRPDPSPQPPAARRRRPGGRALSRFRHGRWLPLHAGRLRNRDDGLRRRPPAAARAGPGDARPRPDLDCEAAGAVVAAAVGNRAPPPQEIKQRRLISNDYGAACGPTAGSPPRRRRPRWRPRGGDSDEEAPAAVRYRLGRRASGSGRLPPGYAAARGRWPPPAACSASRSTADGRRCRCGRSSWNGPTSPPARRLGGTPGR